MIVEKSKVISVSYELRSAGNEQVIEVVDNTKPLEFLFGHGNLLPKFEENLDGKKVGDDFSFILKSKDAYGEYDQEAIQELPKDVFMIDGRLATEMLFIGNIIPMRDQNGYRVDGKITEMTDQVVTMDFNHPMAGKDLAFKGKIEDIREATEEELMHGHVHQPGMHDDMHGGCSGCSCSSDDCGPEDCSDNSCGCSC